MKHLVSDKVYDTIKHISQIGLPAAATLYGTLAQIWDLPYGTEVPATIAAIVTMLSAFLGISSAMYKPDNDYPKGE